MSIERNASIWGILGVGLGAFLGSAAWGRKGHYADVAAKGALVGAALGVTYGALTAYGKNEVSGFPQVGAGARHRSPDENQLYKLEYQLTQQMPNDLDVEGRVQWIRHQSALRSEWAQLKHKLGQDPDIDFTDGGSTYPSRARADSGSRVDSFDPEGGVLLLDTTSGLAIDEAFADVGRRLHGSFRGTGYKQSPRGFVGWRRPMTHAPRIRRRRSPFGA